MNADHPKNIDDDIRKMDRMPHVAQPRVILTESSIKQMKARKKLRGDRQKNSLKQDQIERFLKRRMEGLFERVKLDGALTQGMVSEYLSAFASSALPILGQISTASQSSLIQNFTLSAKKLVDQMQETGGLDRSEAVKSKINISAKSRTLYNKSAAERKKILEDIGGEIVNVSKQVTPPTDRTPDSEFLNRDIIPTLFEKGSDKISLSTFIKFPLGITGQITEGNWMDQHQRYLEIAAEKKLISQNDFTKLTRYISQFTIICYKKYFNIFPNDVFDDSVFMAMFSLWQHNGLDNLLSDTN